MVAVIGKSKYVNKPLPHNSITIFIPLMLYLFSALNVQLSDENNDDNIATYITVFTIFAAVIVIIIIIIIVAFHQIRKWKRKQSYDM